MHMHFCDITSHIDWNFARSKFVRTTGLPLSSKCRAKTYTGKKMVYGTINNHNAWRNTAFWIDIY